MSQNDETATLTQRKLFTCNRLGCSAALGLLLPDGRLQIPADGEAVVYHVDGTFDCAVCGFRNSYDRQRVPPFVEKWYPDGLQQGESDEKS